MAGVTGYLITTSSSVPDAGDPAWQSSPPNAYTFAVNISIVTNTPPTADAGPDQSVKEGVSVTLDGSNSDDGDDGIISYFWEQVSGSLAVVISDNRLPMPVSIMPYPKEHR